MGHDLKLAPGMKFHNIPHSPVPEQKILPFAEGKNPLYEIFPDIQIIETPLLLDRQKRKVPNKSIGKEPPTGLCRNSARIDLHPEKPGTGGPLLENKAAQVIFLQLPYRSLTVLAHPDREVDACPVGNKAGRRRVPFETHRLAWHRQPAADFGTYRYEVKKTTEGIGDIVIMLVTAVIADLFTQETGTDSNCYRTRHEKLL